MRVDRGLIAVLAGTTGLVAGCVDRRFVVETNVPGAEVYVNESPIGPSPADTSFEYPGYYDFRAVAPGFEPLKTRENIKARWYDLPGLDFFAEVLWPGRIEDTRRVQLTLVPARQVNTQELLGSAENLRMRGKALPPSSIPDQTPVPASTPRPVVFPPDSPPTTPAPISPTQTPLPPGTGTNLR
ncbi:MAG TPA: PEGA domain-containing protein [Fimbriiglobus sp.]|jgi:hypothetical protein